MKSKLWHIFLLMICLTQIPILDACCETSLTINDISQATDEELENALLLIKAEQFSRLKTRISLNFSEISITKGKTLKLTSSIEDLPEGVTAGKLIWSTDNAEVATVQNGIVKGVNGGSTVIHCSTILSNSMEIQSDCTVTVTIPVSQIINNKTSFTMKVGEKYTPTFAFKPENASDTSLTFETSDPSIATVEDGTIIAKSDGSVRITASTNDGSNKRIVFQIKVVRTFTNELISFDNKMMKSVSSQINEATDLTTTSNNRAILAALLTLEYQYQCPGSRIDYTKPILVSKSGTMAATVFAVQDDYVMVIYQMHPLSTSYCYLGDDNAAMAKQALEMVSDNVWSVSLNEYTKKLELLIQQIQ